MQPRMISKTSYYKQLLIGLFVLLNSTCFAQEVEEVIIMEKYGKAKYFRLQSDHKTKHGFFELRSHGPEKTVLLSGMYHNGNKEGIWTERYNNGTHSLKWTGSYEQGKRIGIWKFYSGADQLVHKYDYDKQEMIFNLECFNKESHQVLIGGTAEYRELSCPPSRLGGSVELKSEMTQMIIEAYMKTGLLEKLKEGLEEEVSFYVTDTGNVHHIRYTGKDMEVQKLIEAWLSLPEHIWIPGELNGVKVTSDLQISISLPPLGTWKTDN